MSNPCLILSLLLNIHPTPTHPEEDRVASIWERYVTVDSLGPVTLNLQGTTESDEVVDRCLQLPEEFFIEPSRSSKDRRILYQVGDVAYIAGILRPYRSRAELTNVPWGFDLRTQEFWYEAEPDSLPPVPVELDDDWSGLRFRVPVELERSTPDETLKLIRDRSAIVVGPGEPADVVLLPDDVDFIWTRHEEAERLVRQGAHVLWERSSPRAPGESPQ